MTDQEAYAITEQHRGYLFNGELLCSGCPTETKAPCLVLRLMLGCDRIKTEITYLANGYHYDGIEHHCDCGQDVARDILEQLQDI